MLHFNHCHNVAQFKHDSQIFFIILNMFLGFISSHHNVRLVYYYEKGIFTMKIVATASD